MRRRGWIAIAAAAVVVVAGAGVAVAVATRVPPTTTLVVHLVDPRGRPVTGFDDSLRVELQGMTKSGKFGVSRYAASSPQFCYKHHCAKGWVGALHRGVATFPNLPAGQQFDIDASAGHAFLYASHVGYTVNHLQTRSVKFTLVEGAAISGRVSSLAGHPIAGIVVGAVDESGRVVRRATTTSNGDYRLVGLVTGDYRVLFNANPFGDTAPDFAYTPEYYRVPETTEPASVPRFGSGTRISVHQATKAFGGADTFTGNDGVLAPGPTTTVHITLPAGPAPDATLLYVSDGHAADARSIVAGPDGVVTMRLTPEKYTLYTFVPKSAERSR